MTTVSIMGMVLLPALLRTTWEGTVLSMRTDNGNGADVDGQDGGEGDVDGDDYATYDPNTMQQVDDDEDDDGEGDDGQGQPPDDDNDNDYPSGVSDNGGNDDNGDGWDT